MSEVILTIGEFLVALLGAALVGGGFMAVGLLGVIRSVGRDKDQLDRLERVATDLIPVDVLDKFNEVAVVVGDLAEVVKAITDRQANEPIFESQSVDCQDPESPCFPC